MKQSELWEFLNEQDRKIVNGEVKRIIDQEKLPQQKQKLYHQIQIPRINKNHQVDPIQQVIKSKLSEANKQAILNLHRQLTQMLLNMISKTVDRLQQEKTIQYLGAEYSKIVNDACGTNDFQWRIWAHPKGSLWQRLSIQVKKILTGTLRYLMKVYGVKDIDVRSQTERGAFKMEIKLKEDRKKLQNIHFMESSVVKSLIKMEKQEEELIEDKGQTAVEDIFGEIQKIEMEKQGKEKKEDEKDDKMKDETEQKQQTEQYSFMKRVTNKGKQLMGKVTSYFESNGQIQKNLKDFQGADLETKLQLKKQERQFVEKLSSRNLQQFIKMLEGQFSEKDKWDLQYLLRLPFLKWQQNQNILTGPGKLVQANRLELYKWKNTIYGTIKNLKDGKRKQPRIFLVLTGLFYKILQKQYTTLAKRYLVRVLQGIEKLHEGQCPYLRGALKIYEMRNVQPSPYAAKLASELPYRSPKFESTDRSKIYREQIERQYEPGQNKNLLQNEVIAIQRLTYSKPCKNVTFLISGYLSEDTDKDKQWKGIIRALQDTQCYGVLWKSSTIKELLSYLAVIGGGFALKKAGTAYPLIAIAGIGAKIAKGLVNKEAKQDNPFWLALQRADEAGKQFAQMLIKNFSDRHITLIGYSMGTEVIKSCVEQLQKKKMQGILLNVVTMGGVAVRQDVQKIMRHCRSPISWINYQSRKDYSVRYVYRVCILGSRPVGWGGVRKVQGHEVENVDVSELVSAHLLFRRHLYGLTLLTGLNHY